MEWLLWSVNHLSRCQTDNHVDDTLSLALLRNFLVNSVTILSRLVNFYIK